MKCNMKEHFEAVCQTDHIPNGKRPPKKGNAKGKKDPRHINATM
jgi:hypothetical protein